MLFNIVPIALIAASVAALPTGNSSSSDIAHKPLQTGHAVEGNHTRGHKHDHHNGTKNHTREHEHSRTGTLLLRPTASPVVVARHEHDHDDRKSHSGNHTESHRHHHNHTRTHTGTHSRTDLPQATSTPLIARHEHEGKHGNHTESEEHEHRRNHTRTHTRTHSRTHLPTSSVVSTSTVA